MTRRLRRGRRKAAASGQAVSGAGGTTALRWVSRCASEVWGSHKMLRSRVVSRLHWKCSFCRTLHEHKEVGEVNSSDSWITTASLMALPTQGNLLADRSGKQAFRVVSSKSPSSCPVQHAKPRQLCIHKTTSTKGSPNFFPPFNTQTSQHPLGGGGSIIMQRLNDLHSAKDKWFA